MWCYLAQARVLVGISLTLMRREVQECECPICAARDIISLPSVRCIVARRTSSLDAVRKECLALGIGEERIILVNADVTSTSELINVRDRVIESELVGHRLITMPRLIVHLPCSMGWVRYSSHSRRCTIHYNAARPGWCAPRVHIIREKTIQRGRRGSWRSRLEG